MLRVAGSVVKVRGVAKRAAWPLVGGSSIVSSVVSGHGRQSNPCASWEPSLTDPFLKYSTASKPNRKVRIWRELGE